MSRIFITGSSDGLGLMAAQLLVEQGHSVVLHVRNLQRAEATRRRLPGAESIVKGDLASLRQKRRSRVPMAPQPFAPIRLHATPPILFAGSNRFFPARRFRTLGR